MTKRARKYIAGNRQKKDGRKRHRLFMENLRKNKGMLDLAKMKWQEARDYLLTAHVHAATGMQGVIRAEYKRAREMAEARLKPPQTFFGEPCPPPMYWGMEYRKLLFGKTN